MTIFILMLFLFAVAINHPVKKDKMAAVIFVVAALLSNLLFFRFEYGLAYFTESEFIPRDFNQITYSITSSGLFFLASMLIHKIDYKSKLTISMQLLCFVSIMLNIYGIILWGYGISLDTYTLGFVLLYVTAFFYMVPGKGVDYGSRDDSIRPWFLGSNPSSLKRISQLPRIKGKTG